MIALARRMDLFSIVYVAATDEAVEMAKAGADAIIAHVGTTVGGSIGVTRAVVTWDFAIQRTQDHPRPPVVRKDVFFFLAHSSPVSTPPRTPNASSETPTPSASSAPVPSNAWASAVPHRPDPALQSPPGCRGRRRNPDLETLRAKAKSTPVARSAAGR